MAVPSAVSPAAASVPLTFTVDSTAGEVGGLVSDGLCATSSASCTLRAAVHEGKAHA